MKKLLTLLLTLIIASTFFLGGCSCAGEEALSFGGYFYGDNQSVAPPSYSEKTEYEVSFKKVSSFDTSFLSDCDFNGTYTSELYVLTSYEDLDFGTLPDTNIYNVEDGSIYRLITKLDITSSYIIDGKTKTFNDYIYRYAYFFPTDKALMPIYIKEETKTGIPTSDEEKYSIFTTETLYNNNKYTITTTNEETGEIQTKKSYDYSKKTLIDNAELLFAIRNITESKNIPVVAPSYGTKQTLAISKNSDSTYKCNINLINGGESSDVTSTIEVKTFTLRLANNQTSGQEHTVKIQKSQMASLPYKSFMVYYSQPLTVIFYSGVLPTNLGSLEFNLRKIIL